MLLEIESRNLEFDRAGAKVVWNQLQDVKRAEYDHFVFPYAAYTAVAGAMPAVRLEARCTLAEEVRGPAASPLYQQPIDGFVHRTYQCEPIRLVK